jgi:hypothetical protein
MFEHTAKLKSWVVKWLMGQADVVLGDVCWGGARAVGGVYCCASGNHTVGFNSFETPRFRGDVTKSALKNRSVNRPQGK